MRPLRFSIDITVDGCCDHRVVIQDEDTHRRAEANVARTDALLVDRALFPPLQLGDADRLVDICQNQGRGGEPVGSVCPAYPLLRAVVALTATLVPAWRASGRRPLAALREL